MAANRIRNLINRRAPRFTFPERAAKAAPALSAFVLCPAASFSGHDPMQLAWQQHLYQRAYEEARSMVAARRRDRRLAPRPN